LSDTDNRGHNEHGLALDEPTIRNNILHRG
jgi:hypothetical protein